MLPTFIIIGAMKSGTTSLHRYLSLHPDIFMATARGKRKPLHFFVLEKNYPKGLVWYESHFSAQAKASGEASGSYTKFPRFSGVPQRMAAVIPDARLIYLLREPVERTLVHYVHNYLEGEEHRSISQAFANLEKNHYVECSRYYRQLEQYLPYYSKEQILLVSSDELKHYRRDTLKKVFRFLDVDDSFYCPEYEIMFHQTSQKKQQNSIGRYISESPLAQAIKPSLPSWCLRAYERMTSRAIEKPKADDALKERLRNALEDDVEALRDYSGNKFAHWKLL